MCYDIICNTSRSNIVLSIDRILPLDLNLQIMILAPINPSSCKLFLFAPPGQLPCMYLLTIRRILSFFWSNIFFQFEMMFINPPQLKHSLNRLVGVVGYHVGLISFTI